MKEYLQTRKHGDMEFKFYLTHHTSIVDDREFTSIHVEGPDNCFGYPNTIYFTQNGWGQMTWASTRHLPGWIGARLAIQVARLAHKHNTKEEA